MKQTIRLRTFETNSSSTHSCIICSDEELEKLNKEEVYINNWTNEIVTKEEVLKRYIEEKQVDENGQMRIFTPDMIEEDDFNDWLYESEYYTFDNWQGDLEVDEREYITKSGDKINIICKFGYDS